MISPITIATQGLLNSPLSVAAVRGRLRIETDLPEDVVRGGSSQASPAVILARLRREDDEILAIIMASVDLLE